MRKGAKHLLKQEKTLQKDTPTSVRKPVAFPDADARRRAVFSEMTFSPNDQKSPSYLIKREIKSATKGSAGPFRCRDEATLAVERDAPFNRMLARIGTAEVPVTTSAPIGSGMTGTGRYAPQKGILPS